MERQDLQWVRKGFKKNKVWQALGPDGSPLVSKGRVLIKYQLDQEHQYWVNPEGVYDLVEPPDAPPSRTGDPVPGETPAKPRKTASFTARPKAPVPAEPSPDTADPAAGDTVMIYTDGASSGNPGPSGIGVVMRCGTHEREISTYIGIATNNIAELTAIETALDSLKRTDLPVRLYTDSSYALGLLTGGWKARKNTALVARIKKRMARFRDLKFIKVAGHSGIRDNERADQLATGAITARPDGS